MRVKQGEANLKKIRRKRATPAPYLAEHTQEEEKPEKIRRKCAAFAPYLADHTRECQPRHPQVMRAGQPLIK
jgi:hypothetical protein